MFNIKKVKKLINKHKIISFDIFDTLLLRPYMKPTDVFLHIEENEKMQGFSAARINAERKARTKADAEDIALDDIYSEIDSKYKYLKNKELEYEFQTIQPNTEVIELFNYAKKQNKNVILISDMYLPYDFIISLLEKNKITGFARLFLSSKEQSCKCSGNLYKKVLKNLNCNPNDILHIGDNKQADYIKAKDNGINAVLYPDIAESFFKQYFNYKYRILYKKYSNSLEISIILKMIILNQKYNSKDYWTNFGFNAGGAVCYGFVKYILDIAKENNIDKLLFVSRDGYPLIRIFNLINNTDIKSEYFYSSRNLLKTEDLSNYKNYYEKVIGDAKRISLVDTIAVTYSVVRVLKKIDKTDRLKKCILWHATETAQKREYYKICSIYSNGLNACVPEYYDYIELFMTSPEPPILGFENDKPKYQENVSKYERFRQKIIPFMCNGEIAYTKQLLSIFGDIEVKFSANFLTKLVDNYTKIINLKDFYFLSKVKYATERDHTRYRTILQIKSLNFGLALGENIKHTIFLLKLFPNFFN